MKQMQCSSQIDESFYGKSTRNFTKKKKKSSYVEYIDFTPKNPYKKDKRKLSARTWDEFTDE